MSVSEADVIIGSPWTKTAPSLNFSAGWNVSAPIAGTLDDVVITFDRPIDHALALKSISIRGASGVLNGQAVMISDDTWSFTPADPWVEQAYVVYISPLVEDVAGNNLNNAFDLDLSKEKRINSQAPIKLTFIIKNDPR